MGFLVGRSECCATCGREISAGTPCVPTLVHVRTRGISPRVEAPGQMVYQCQPCGLLLANGSFPEGAYNRAVWVGLRDIFASDAAVGEAAVAQMNKEWTPELRQAMIARVSSPEPRRLLEGEILAPERPRLKAAG